MDLLAKLLPRMPDPVTGLVIEAGQIKRNYWRDLFRYRELFDILAWRNVLARYEQTMICVIGRCCGRCSRCAEHDQHAIVAAAFLFRRRVRNGSRFQKNFSTPSKDEKISAE